MFIPELLEREFMLSQVLGFMTYAAATNSDNPTNLGSLERSGPLGEATLRHNSF